MEKEKLDGIFRYPYGICAFESIREHLLPCRRINDLPANAKSVIVTVFPYKVKNTPPENICRYAAVPDYHTVCGKSLQDAAARLSARFPGFCFVPFMDNSPVPEVHAGTKAGLGVRGENHLLITEQYGSFVFIGEIVTDLPLAPSDPGGECIHCGACKKACPVGLKTESCLSALTQKKGELTENEQKIVKNGGLVWGCDRCAEVCPLNRGTKCTDIAEFIDGYHDRYVIGEDDTGRAYAWRKPEVIRRNARLLEQKTD